jgi:cell division septation protein DedD
VTAPRRRARGRSRLGVLLGLALLTIPGFGLGALAGLLWEEPGLVAAYLFGRTEAVALPAGAHPGAAGQEGEGLPSVAAGQEGEGLPSVAAAPAPRPAAPEAPGRAGAAPERAARAPGRIARAAAEAPTARGRVSVQVGAFVEKSAADELAGSLRQKGYAAYVAAGEAGGSARWRVRVGPLPTREEGERQAARLKREERLPTWVLDEAR